MMHALFSLGQKRALVAGSTRGLGLAMARGLAVEWGRHHIQVNGIGRGSMTTELNAPLMNDPKFDQWIQGRTPLGRRGRPEELAGAAVFLACAASDFITGQVLCVDGGILAAL